MKEHFQDYGVRKWAGDDLIELQSEPLAALQTLVEPYAPCIIQGCEVTENGNEGITVSPGLVALKGKDSKGNACVKIARFAGIESETSIYLTLACEAVNRAYGDGKVKNIAYDYKAVASTQCPEEPFLKISGKEVPRLVDTLGITQKLDRVGGDASQTKVNFSEEKAEELKSGNPLSKLFGAIKKCLTSITTKLEGIDDNANAYTHPSSAAGAKTSGLYKIATDANGHVTEAVAVAKSDITDLGIPAQDTVYNHPASAAGAKTSGLYKIATDANGHVTEATAVGKSDITALGIPAQDTVYTHPATAGNKHIPSGGSSGQYLKYYSDGTAVWSKPTASEIGAAAVSHTHSYLPLAGGTITGNLRLKGNGNFGNKLNFGDGEYVYLHEAADDKLTIYSKSGIDFAASSTSQLFNVKGQLQENGQRVYSPNNKPPQATTSADGLMSASDKSKLNGIAVGAQVNPAYATASIISTVPTNTDGYYQTGASNSGSYMNLVGSSNTVARGDHKHSLFIPDATTSKPGLMSAADKKQLTDFQIVGIYFTDTGRIAYGFKSVNLYCQQGTHGNEKCLRIKMPAEEGNYMILPLAPQSRYFLTTYSFRWGAGEEAIVFHRDPNGNAGYYKYGVGFILLKTPLTLTA